MSTSNNTYPISGDQAKIAGEFNSFLPCCCPDSSNCGRGGPNSGHGHTKCANSTACPTVNYGMSVSAVRISWQSNKAPIVGTDLGVRPQRTPFR